LPAGPLGSSTKENPPEKSGDKFSWPEFGRHYRKAFVWIVILTAVVHVMEVSGVLKGFEMAGLDTFLRLHGRQMSQRVVIVEITNEDYKDAQLFGGKSPLNNEQLLKLVSSVQTYHPAAIGMDFDTNSEDWCHLDPSRLANVLPPPAASNISGNSPVVWAEIPESLEEPLGLSPVLGGMLQDPRYTGIPRFPVDSDGLVRRYESKFLVAGALEACPQRPSPERDHSSTLPGNPSTAQADSKDDHGSMDSFARAILHHACANPGLNCSTVHQDSDHPVIFNFYGDRYRFPIIQSREFLGPSVDARSPDRNVRQRREALLKDKIVLIGGNFNAARDVYLTPLGEMAGVELIALAIESDFDGGIRETQKWLEKLADLVVGTLIVLIYFYYRRRPRVALGLSLIGIPFVATAFSLLLFRTAAYWFNFAPIIIGMVLHQMLELSESCGELQEEVHELKGQLHACREAALPTEPPDAKPSTHNDVAPTNVTSPPANEEPHTKTQ
jgi:CHASE2 domain-containing sensor protein